MQDYVRTLSFITLCIVQFVFAKDHVHKTDG